MRISKSRRAELKALAEKARKSFKEGLSCVEFQTASRQALPDALEDIEELESKLADAVKALEDIEANGYGAWVEHALAKLRAK